MTNTIDEIEGLLARATVDARPWSQVAHEELALALRSAAPDLIAVVRAAHRVDTIDVEDPFLPEAFANLREALARLGVKP